jgi:hypothetical protein
MPQLEASMRFGSLALPKMNPTCDDPHGVTSHLLTEPPENTHTDAKSTL